MGTHADISKFKDKRELPNKRAATRFVYEQAADLAEQVGPENIRALVLPSANMYDIEQLKSLQVLESNIVAVERDRESFDLIRASSVADMPSCPSGVSLTLALMPEGRKFNFVFLDFLGPACEKFYDYIGNIASRLEGESAFVAITVKCGREHNPQDFDWQDLVAEHFGGVSRNDKRRWAVRFMLRHPSFIENGWSVVTPFETEYTADGKSRSKMLCFGARYAK